MTDIPEAAIEAAAEAMYRDGPMTRWGDLDDVIAEGYRKDARAAIAAAMPAIRGAIAEEIEVVTDPGRNPYWENGMREAASIVRGAQ